MESFVEKKFAVQPEGELRINTQRGSIRLQHSTDNTVTIVAIQGMQPDIGMDAAVWSRRHSLTMEQNDTVITVAATCGRRPGFVMGGHAPGTWPPVYADFVVSLPASWSVSLATESGDVDVCDLSGNVVVQTSRGNVRLGKVGGHATVAARRGGIFAQSLPGAAALKARDGNIQVHETGGALRAAVEGAGHLQVGFAGMPKGDSALSVAQGTLTVTVPKDSAFRLDAAARYGKIRVAPQLAPVISKGGQGGTRMLATIGNEGALIKLNGNDNDIIVAAE